MKVKRLLLEGIVISLIIPWERALAQPGQYGGWHMGPGMMGGGWGMGWFGMVIMLVFWVLVIVGLVYLIKWLARSSRGEAQVPRAGSNALEILKERYARGEIEKAEFEEKKRDLAD